VIARPDHESQLVRALGSIGAATLTSRILGFVRDVIVARAFGAGPLTDAFFVAYRIPNILRRLLGEGALSTAIVPVFSDYLLNRDRPEFERMLRATRGAALIVLAAVTGAGIAAAPWIVRLMAPGFARDPAQMALTVTLTRLMFPYLVLVGLSALTMGTLNAHGRFFMSALGPAVLNVGMIVTVLLLSAHAEPPILSLAVGVLAGGLGQLAVQVPELRREGLPLGASLEPSHPALRRIGRLLLPSIFGLAAVQVTVFVNTLLASVLQPGSISFLYYADRVMEFPLGVFGVALASASLPAMSRQAAAGDAGGLARTLGFALRLSFFVAMPAAVGLVMLRVPIIRTLFERGEFGPADTVATAWAMACYAVGLPAFSGTRIAAQAYYARGEPRTAVTVGIVSLAVNIVLAIGLMRLMGHAGLALASSGSAYAHLFILLWLARGRLGGLGVRNLLDGIGRTGGATAVLAAWLAVVLRTWPVSAGPLAEAGWLALAIASGGLVFWLASITVRSPERVALLRSLRSPEAR
jgi:putative peptidoglycan lipid II flippase